MVSLTELHLRAVRARIAEVTSVNAVPAVLGSIRLRPHQQRAAARAAQLITRQGGCLLADDVGRGKTYVALTVARQWHRPLAVVPASLRTTWQRAMARARVPCALVTHEALSRGALPSFAPDGVIVDESHRFRSPGAKRHAALAAITAHAPVLLLSATPLQNGTRDLAAQLALFLGSAAFRSREAALARFVVRSAEPMDAELPAVAPPEWLHASCDDTAVLRAILSLPPPARPFDAGDAGALRIIGLVRAWASSRAALVGALRRRSHAVTALEQCAASGLAPARRDLRAWLGVDGDVQLAFAPLLVPRADDESSNALLEAVHAERTGLDRLRDALRDSPDPDQARVEALRRLRAEHPGARILAFSEFATTVRAYYALLRADAGIGLLTANDARIASGRLPRDALLHRFAPSAQGASDPPLRERVTLLLSTDLLSEGVNLQDASIVTHLDLPWNPARLAQRLGRVRRPGGAATVHSYLMAPPATTELLLRVDARLRTKLAHAERAIGRTLDVMPGLAAVPESLAPTGASSGDGGSVPGANAELLGALADRVATWRRASSRYAHRCPRAPLVAAVTSGNAGWLAALDDARLLARVGSSGPDTSAAVAVAVELATGVATPCTLAGRDRALHEASAWLEREALSLECGVQGDASSIVVAIESRIAHLLDRTARHERPLLLALAASLRRSLDRARSLGAERELEGLLQLHRDRALTDVEWLERSGHVAARSPRPRPHTGQPRVVALIVLDAASGE